MPNEIIVNLPPYLCAQAYDVFNGGKVCRLGPFIEIGALLLGSDFQAFSTQSMTLQDLTHLDMRQHRLRSVVQVVVEGSQLSHLRDAQAVAQREFDSSSLSEAATLSLTELMIHAQNKAEDADEHPDLPAEFFADYLPLDDGSFVLVEPHKPPRLEL